MTTEFEGLKTNEFLRRRKLRLQQVREQSKDIAKKIRQRAKVEQLREVAELDSKKEQEYLQRQEKLVKRLEQLYAKGVSSVGDGHKQAAELTQVSPEKPDLSKQRGREATAELRKKKQEQLDEQKKLLDRKLHAREAANEISREKSSNIASKLTKTTSTILTDQCKDKTPKEAGDFENDAEKETVKQIDMATQWEFDVMPNEWEPCVPALSLPKEDSEKESFNINNNTEIKSDKSKRVDLFALSEEMPSSLRGGLTDIPEERVAIKPSFTQVSEYLQSRGLRLRETDKVVSKPTGDLQSLKQTIMHTRPTMTKGSISSNVCHVLDEQVIPVPYWEAEPNCRYCSHKISDHYGTTEITATNSQINKVFSSIRSKKELPPSPMLRGSSPFRRNKVPQALSGKGKPREKSPISSMSTSSIAKKNSVTVYNHATRDSRNIPRREDSLVVHSIPTDEDAYSQAVKESSISDLKEREHQQRLQEMRSKIAMTKQNVEKEYNDTLSFLNSLPKEKGSKTVKTAYMDERREKMLKDSRQHKMQQEFRKIEKECRKHSSMNSKRRSSESHRCRSQSPESRNNFAARDFQYSWMPVPDSDGSLAIHTIPTTKPKSANSVKFSKVDSYHEYRSRHKHTPPTKEANQEKPKRVVETVLVQNGSESEDPSSSDTSSVENLGLGSSASKNKTKKKRDEELTEAEKIIIYKVLGCRKKDKAKKKAKLISNIAKSLQALNEDKSNEDIDDNESPKEQLKENRVSFEHIQEGIYKASKDKGDNVASLYFTENTGEGRTITLTQDEILHGKPCRCGMPPKDQYDAGVDVHMGKGDRVIRNRERKDCKCGCTSKLIDCPPVPPAPQPSAATSTASFKTANNDKECPAFPEGGVVKLVDNEGQEAGKFYIGASGFLKDDDYEVIIQLRKKDSGKEEKQSEKQADVVLYTINEALHNEELVVPVSNTNITSENKEKDPAADDKIENEPIDKAEETLQDIPVATAKNENCESIEKIPTNNPEKIISSSNFSEINEAQEKKYSDKGVCTSFQLSYTTPSKSGPLATPKPATSTHTQTTFNAITRPAYIHMSSSTSTAYMSPPEVVLPRYFKRDSDEDTNKAFNSEFGRYEKHYKDCTCGKCFTKKTNMECNIPSKKKRRCSKAKIPTPPNTCCSYSTTCELPCNYGAKTQKYKSRKCKRCDCSTNSVNSRKSQEKRTTRNTTAKKKPVLPRHTIPSVASSSKHGSNFNPLIKNYVNRLLSLNKEGLKALEVANQECSSVATPGSSIIDVPRNIIKQKTAEPKLSMEQIKHELIKKILTEYVNKTQTEEKCDETKHDANHIHIKVSAPRLPKKRSIHKVKSLNISKRILKNKKSEVKKNKYNEESYSSPSSLPLRSSDYAGKMSSVHKEKFRSKSSPSPRQTVYYENKNQKSPSDIVTIKCPKNQQQNPFLGKNKNNLYHIPQHRASSARLDSSTGNLREYIDQKVSDKQQVPIAISTQTSRDMDSDTNYVKLAENKLQNMEKIADLTEKCTQRLSNLAKVLDEVRKNKSLAYSQISTSDSASEADQRSDKFCSNPNSTSGQSTDLAVNDQGKLEPKLSTPVLTSESEESETLDSSKYISVLTDIPRPMVARVVQTEMDTVTENTENNVTKPRTRPPPALSRMHLRHIQGIIPHELSTVVEVDSPMSVRLKNQSSHTDNKGDMLDSNESNSNINKEVVESPLGCTQVDKNKEERIANPDLLENNFSLSKTILQQKISATDSSDESKLQMMDLKQFNEIMLQPFISINEYAKQYDIGTIDEASNLDEVAKDGVVNEDLSSMQSDSSLPDVIAELLKRKIITEPFKFDTVSNIHSTTESSESSVLALSKVRKEKKKATVLFQDKENVAESSDTLSFSSNPDLENAFKKLGMGWASSTLKKTKERLALSSSSNTSSSSVSQFKIKSFNQDIPAVTDSVSLTKKEEKRYSKNNGQQTTMAKSMTVREFLTNELADKITFTNKSRRNDTAEEFVSLYETKMPEEMKHSSQMIGEERSIDSGPGNRARTSTPVQIFKSMTYHSSSSSNMSTGLFSNADDLSSVKVTSNSIRNHSTSDKDDLTIPNCSLRVKKPSDASKSD